MSKHFLLITLLFSSSIAFSQSPPSALGNINTVEEAELFIDKNPRSGASLFTLNGSIDTSAVIQPLYNKKKGFVFNIGKDHFKILKVDSALSFRVKYIFLNGEQFTKTQADSLRNEIILKYKTGISFHDLVREYNMDGNFTGNTGWFTENMMVQEFESAVKAHLKGDIFTVDTPGQNWYHVVLKTDTDTFIKTMRLIRINGK